MPFPISTQTDGNATDFHGAILQTLIFRLPTDGSVWGGQVSKEQGSGVANLGAATPCNSSKWRRTQSCSRQSWLP